MAKKKARSTTDVVQSIWDNIESEVDGLDDSDYIEVLNEVSSLCESSATAKEEERENEEDDDDDE